MLLYHSLGIYCDIHHDTCSISSCLSYYSRSSWGRFTLTCHYKNEPSV
jgi:hypothetical protein